APLQLMENTHMLLPRCGKDDASIHIDLKSRRRRNKERVHFFNHVASRAPTERTDWATYYMQGLLKYQGIEHFLLTHGRYWIPQPLPSDFRLGRLHYCGKNACRLALRHPELTLVEGYAVLARRMLYPFRHSWVVDVEGRVIDNTWREPGEQYL